MSKSKVTVSGPVQGELCRLDYLMTGDAFVSPADGSLCIVVTPMGDRVDGVDCLRFTPCRGLRRFSRGYQVLPVDLNIEWSVAQ